MRIKKKSLYYMKLSGYQVDVIIAILECALSDGFFDEKDKIIAKSLLISLKKDLEELE